MYTFTQRLRTKAEMVQRFLSGKQTETFHQMPVLDAHEFSRRLRVERKRSERSGKPVLMGVVDAAGPLRSDKSGRIRETLIQALSRSARDTDIIGWYKADAIIAAVFTEIKVPQSTAIHALRRKLEDAVQLYAPAQVADQIDISIYLFSPTDATDSVANNVMFFPRHARHKSPDNAKPAVAPTTG